MGVGGVLDKQTGCQRFFRLKVLHLSSFAVFPLPGCSLYHIPQGYLALAMLLSQSPIRSSLSIHTSSWVTWLISDMV